jgi:hypothetical protein
MDLARTKLSTLTVAAAGTEVATFGTLPNASRVVVFAKIDVAAGANLVMSVEASPDDGTTWCTTPIVDLAGADIETLVDTVTVAADVTAALMCALYPTEHVRVRIDNSGGTGGATVTLYARAD